MASADRYTIENGIPSLVLMERAALSVLNVLEENELDLSSVLIVCGTGNNAADGVALARLLLEKGYEPDLYLSGNTEKYSPDLKKQLEIISRYEVLTVSRFDPNEYTLIVDALFGNGLKREISGEYARIIERINASDTPVVSIDIPSGLNATDGHVLGTAVSADITVTFQYAKAGQLLVDGPALCGDLYVENIGIFPFAETEGEEYYAVTDDDLDLLPPRDENGNKATFGKLLIIAGSSQICGAAYLCAHAALKCGIGMVKIFTSKENRTALSALLPEALITCYGENTKDLELLKQDLEWADSVLIGPGLGTDDFSKEIFRLFLRHNRLPAVLDADALNILAEEPELWNQIGFDCIITPHVGEMSRLCGLSKDEIKSWPIRTASDFAVSHRVTCVLKDSVTVTAYPGGPVFINTTGCSALATAGSGDVLAGIIAGYITRYEGSDLSLAAMAVYVHGAAGERAAEDLGADAVTASDLQNYI